MNDISFVKDVRAAMKQGDYERFRDLIINNKGALNMKTPFGTWLHMAASRGELSLVKFLVDIGADINVNAGTFGGTAINQAASDGQYDVVIYLYSCGAKLDTSEPERNPLFGAILKGNIDIVRFLLDKGIDASVRYTGKYMTNMDAYDFAIENGQKEIAEMLLPYRK